MDVFTIGFITITWVDILDVLLVSFLFYRLYVAMRGTIAAQVFLGLMLVIIGSIVAHAVDMKALSWILKNAHRYLGHRADRSFSAGASQACCFISEEIRS